MTEVTISIEEQYQEYLAKADTGSGHLKSILRILLVQRLFRERTNIFEDAMLSKLLSKEVEFNNINPRRSSTELLSLIPLIKIHFFNKGLRKYSLQEAEQEDFFLSEEAGTFYQQLVKWTALQGLKEDDSSITADVLRRTEMRTFLNTEGIDVNKIEDIVKVADDFDRLLAETSIEDAHETKLDMILASCLILFLFYYRLGQHVNANYYLMKASQINFENNDFEMLILFLEKAILLENETPR